MPELPLRNLTAEEVEDFERDGVICARGLFAPEWIERMGAAVDRVLTAPTLLGNVVSMKNDGFRGDLFLWKTDDDFRDWVYDSPASHVAQQVLRSKTVRHFYDQLFVKPAGCHVPTPWHHDVTFWPVDVECRSLVSLWITFDPVDRKSSGLEFVKGSHRWPGRFKAITPNYDPYMLDSDFEDLPEIDAQRDDYDLFCPDMEPGDCLVFNAHVVHGSSSNYSTDKPRRAFSTRWAGDGVIFENRHATMPLLWDHGLLDGDPIGGSLFPRVLPEPIEAEGSVRRDGPEPPDPATVQTVLTAIGDRVAKVREQESVGPPAATEET
ncbi:MAG: phytanoyl-CoA dioxygenase family protein [Myxococcota bacterium]|nr:phytanoyl-CoA dioxygenase family protein [Myxococcota bacterium]